jgi:hypothetical protein
MNERIKELAAQAGATVNERSGYTDYGTLDLDVEKFAESLIRESSKWIVDNSTAEWRKDDLSPEFFAQRLLKHFGVEE